jgi:glycosyltransferase involved in cell wall biosynthesis
MRRSLRRADLVVANTPAARVAYIELADLDPDRVVTIPNGFDPADFRSAENGHRGAEFVIGHAGTLHDPSPPLAQGPKARLRWRWRQVDEAGRSARYLIEALALTRGAGDGPPEPVRLDLVGHVHPGHLRLAQLLGVDGRIVERGYESHATAIAILSRADMIFVPLHGVPSGERALVVPGKLYEALATGRRLLAALPEGDAADLVRLTGAGPVVAPGDVEGLRSAIEDERDAVGHGARAGAPAALLDPFTRVRLVERFADALDATRNGRPQRSDDPWQETRGLAGE